MQLYKTLPVVIAIFGVQSCVTKTDEAGPPGSGDAGSTAPVDGSTSRTDDLGSYLLGLGTLLAPGAEGPSSVPCGSTEGCQVEVLAGPSEFGCGYNLSREVRVAAESLVSLGPDPDLWPGNVLRASAASLPNPRFGGHPATARNFYRFIFPFRRFSR